MKKNEYLKLCSDVVDILGEEVSLETRFKVIERLNLYKDYINSQMNKILIETQKLAD